MNQKQMIAQHLEKMIAQHPDVNPSEDEMLTWLAEHPYLGGIATYYGLDTKSVLRADLSHSFQYGIEFAQQNGRPPSLDDWRAGYFDRANQFAQDLGISLPYDKPHNRLRYEYGGPF